MLLSIGVETDIKLVERLTLVQEDLGKIIEARGARVRWVKPELVHLPLKFIGQYDENPVPEIIHLIEETVAPITPFFISTVGIEAFPSPTCPRIISVSTMQGYSQLMALRFLLDEAFAANHYPSDPRAYRPTMTLGRIATPKKKIDFSDAINAIKDLNFGVSEVAEVVLYGAELRESGAATRVLSRHLLGTAPMHNKIQHDVVDDAWRL